MLAVYVNSERAKLEVQRSPQITEAPCCLWQTLALMRNMAPQAWLSFMEVWKLNRVLSVSFFILAMRMSAQPVTFYKVDF